MKIRNLRCNAVSIMVVTTAILIQCPALRMSALSSADLNTIRARYIASLLPQDAADQQQLFTAAARLAGSLSADETWADVHFADTVRSTWRAAPHLEHTLVLAKAAALDRQRGHPNQALEAKALAAYRLWIVRDPHNSNWWWNEIGVPQLLGEIATLLRPQLTTMDMEQLRPILQRSVWTKWTGANLVWGVTIQIVRGMLYEDGAAVAQGYGRLYEEISTVPPFAANGGANEGIQADDSFHQHGSQFYSGGYGRAFAEDVGRFIAFSWGTALQIPSYRMQTYSAFVLDGEQWMIRDDVFDYATAGREITRPSPALLQPDNISAQILSRSSAYLLGNVVTALGRQPVARQSEFRSFGDRLKRDSAAPSLVGNKHFWTSDYMAHRRSGYLTSVRMFSTRTQDYELVNGEGLKSTHLADGLNLLYRTGQEYRDIFPVWDWTLLPGTTAVHATQPDGVPDTVEPVRVPRQGERGKTNFVGGVSDGQYGVASMDLHRGPLEAVKSCFFFDRLYVALGAGIHMDGSESKAEIATDVNQSLLAGEVLVNGKQLAVSEGTHFFPAGTLHAVWHDHTGYVLGPHTVATLSNQIQTGRWSEIGTGPDALVSKPVFNLWIHHGVALIDAGYQYTVLPEASSAQTMSEYRHPSVQVLSNTSAIQAVFSQELERAEIAFRQAGSLDTPLGKISVNHPVLLMVARYKGALSITAANPDNEGLNLEVHVGEHAVAMTLPAGERAGSSVTMPMQLR